ncbi:MAG: glycosyltransferase family 4 protein [Acidobacteria bacterium]|nr:glycosyltransferase family 4 protein [Acidobacteriota bacterium]
MRIGICARTWGENGGIGVYTRSVIASMLDLDARNEYHILYSNKVHLGSLKGTDRVREVYLPANGKWMWDQWAVPRYAHRERLDVIFHTKFAIPFLAKCRTAMVLHGTERFVHPEFHQSADLWFFKTVYPQYLKRASLIIAVSNRAKEDIISYLGIDPEKVRVAYLATDPIFRPISDPEQLELVREKYNLPPRFILFAGHIYPGKNFGRLLEAFSTVRKDMNIHLVVAGGMRWKYQNDLNALETLGLQENVHFAGYVPQNELVGFYNLAAATVFPSHYESFGLPNIEANACGCPLVTSRTGGMPEAAGNAAVYVDPLDVADIANAIVRVLTDEDLRQTLIAKGYENAARFSWEKTARATLDALEWAVAPAK